MHWYIEVLRKYAVFSGRARRKEYWMFNLFNVLFTMLAVIFLVVGITIENLGMGLFYILYNLAVMVPGLAVLVRRLHDVNKSGWMLLVALIPIIGAIWLLILLLKDSDKGENKYGANPKDVIPPQLSENSITMKSDEEPTICHSCGTQYTQGHKFCKNCGNSLASTSFGSVDSNTKDTKSTHEAQNLQPQTIPKPKTIYNAKFG